jgi:hypothetical protein
MELGVVSYVIQIDRGDCLADNFKMNRWSAKSSETQMPIDLESLQTVICDSAQGVFPTSDRHGTCEVTSWFSMRE